MTASPPAGSLAALLLLAASPLSPVADGREQENPITFAVDVNAVSVTAVVLDRSGGFVHGLTAPDVELSEDGVPQPLSYFAEASSQAPGAEPVPLSVVLALDTSGSMGRSLSFLQEAVLSFVRRLEDADESLVVSFNDSVKGSVDFTEDVDRLERFVDGLQAWGGTSLYDAVHYSLGRIKDRPGRKAVIVFSDGADTTSAMRDKAVVDYARAVEATVYTVGFKGGGGGGPHGFLRRVAAETGGRYFEPDKVGELAKVFGAISGELKNHYLLSYSPQRPPDGTWRAISLKVRRPVGEVRVRKGYFAILRRPARGSTRQ